MKDSFNNVYLYKGGSDRVQFKEGSQINNAEKKIENNKDENIKKQVDELFPNKDGKRNIKQTKTKKEKNKKTIKPILIISVIAALSIALTKIFLFLFVLNKKNEKEDEKNYQEEKLIVKMNYIPNNLLKFRSSKIINLEVNTDDSGENGNNMNKNNTMNMTQLQILFLLFEKKKMKKMIII